MMIQINTNNPTTIKGLMIPNKEGTRKAQRKATTFNIDIIRGTQPFDDEIISKVIDPLICRHMYM